MEPELAQFGSQNKDIDVLLLNIDERDSAEYAPYADYMTSRGIPFTVIVDREGKVKDAFTGYRDMQAVEKAVQATL